MQHLDNQIELRDREHHDNQECWYDQEHLVIQQHQDNLDNQDSQEHQTILEHLANLQQHDSKGHLNFKKNYIYIYIYIYKYIYIYIYRILFGNSDHLHGNVFHTVPGKKGKHKKKTQNQYSSECISCLHSNTTTVKVPYL